MEELGVMIKALVESVGSPVRMGTKLCAEHKKKNENCCGCVSEKACKKYAEIFALHIQALIYQPKSLQEQVENTEYVAKKTKEILEK